MSHRIARFEVHDVRFPTSRYLDGSDAMNRDPDYSAAYLNLRAENGLEGYGFTFTIGRGTEVAVQAIRAVEPLVVGLETDAVFADMGGFWRYLINDSQLRWLGPEKGVMHMAIGAVVNAMWDMYARREGKPLWKLLCDMSPRQLVDTVDFRYLTDAITQDEALEMLEKRRFGAADREKSLLANGFPAYTTSAGWLGYADDKVVRLCKEAIADGFQHVKLKVGLDIEDDARRCALVRDVLGTEIRLSVDANQRWDVGEAIANIQRLAQFDLYWVEEPTSPDDILGHRAIKVGTNARIATGEHAANRVVFKQFLASDAIDVCQIDAARVAGVNENLAILLLAAKFNRPVCPHAGGVGLCEVVQHLSMFDFVALSGTTQDRWIEYVDHLHEHFTEPVRIEHGHYAAPTAPGGSAQIREDSLRRFSFPDGPEWTPYERPES